MGRTTDERTSWFHIAIEPGQARRYFKMCDNFSFEMHHHCLPEDFEFQKNHVDWRPKDYYNKLYSRYCGDNSSEKGPYEVVKDDTLQACKTIIVNFAGAAEWVDHYKHKEDIPDKEDIVCEHEGDDEDGYGSLSRDFYEIMLGDLKYFFFWPQECGIPESCNFEECAEAMSKFDLHWITEMHVIFSTSGDPARHYPKEWKYVTYEKEKEKPRTSLSGRAG